MKKILCAVLAILLIFTGCSMKESKIQPLPSEFSENVTIRHKNTDYNAKLEHSGSQTKIIYSQPKALGGLTLIKNGDNCTALLSGLNVDIKENILTRNSAIFLIDAVLAALFSENAKLETKRQDDVLVISGSVGDKKFEAVRYRDLPKLKSINIPAGELTVSFEQETQQNKTP